MDLYNLVVSAKLQKGGGGGDVDVDPVTITENGIYSASSGHAYSPVTVSVPQSGITPTGTKDINANGIYDVTNFASASVAVPGASGTSVITSNGIYDIASFASASVNVPGIVPSGTSSITANGIYDITNFASVDVNVSGGGGGDHDAEDAIIMRTLSGYYENSRVTFIGYQAFYHCDNLTSVSFANVESTGSYVFGYCSNLVGANLPKLKSMSAYAFRACSKLESVILPICTDIGASAFVECSKLNYINAPELLSISDSAFCGCKSLVTISFPNLTDIGLNAFMSCTSLTTAYFPKLQNLGNCFRSCSKFESLYLLSTSVATLASANCFFSTPMSMSGYLGHFGSIYVPASLVDSYKTANVWSVYASRITSYVE